MQEEREPSLQIARPVFLSQPFTPPCLEQQPFCLAAGAVVVAAVAGAVVVVVSVAVFARVVFLFTVRPEHAHVGDVVPSLQSWRPVALLHPTTPPCLEQQPRCAYALDRGKHIKAKLIKIKLKIVSELKERRIH